MKSSSTNLAVSKLCLMVILSITAPQGVRAATIGIGNAFGSFFDIGGVALTEGGVSIGYFTVSLPSAASAAATTSFSNFQSTFGYQDVRTLLDINGNAPTFQSGSWDFSPSYTGGTLITPATPSNPPAAAYNHLDNLTTFAAGGTTGTALYAVAFNKGNYANGFAGSTRWALVTGTAFGSTANDWIYPTSSENIQLSQINNSSEVLAGVDGASAGIVGVGTSDVVMVALVPEPSTGALMMIGAVGLVALRRLRKV